MDLMIYFKLTDPEIRKHYNRTQERLKLGMVSSFDPYNMYAKVERTTAKTGCPSCTNWTIYFKSTRVSDENPSVTNTFHLFTLKTFFAFNMHHSKPHTKIETHSDFVCYFSCI